jgi:hypothetical protein
MDPFLAGLVTQHMQERKACTANGSSFCFHPQVLTQTRNSAHLAGKIPFHLAGSGLRTFMSEDTESNAARFFRQHPELREKISQSKEFEDWKLKNFKVIEMEGVQYFIARGIPMVSGGDRLMDEAELMLEWARKSGLAPP